MTSRSEPAGAFERERRASASAGDDTSIARLLGELIGDAQALMRREIDLAREEVSHEVGKVKQSAVVLGAGVGLASVGGILLGHTLALLGTLTLGLSLTISMFAVVYGVAFAPLPYPDDDRVVVIEAQRLHQRVMYDLEMFNELGFCRGVENYSRHLTGKAPGEPPPTLYDYLPEDMLVVIDESHQSVPQIRAMYTGDRSRKMNLVEYGFRLPSALDNRPLKFEEWEQRVGQVIYVSATPGPYELTKANGVFVEQVIRPTGLLDPEVEIRPVRGQIDDLLGEVRERSGRALCAAGRGAAARALPAAARRQCAGTQRQHPIRPLRHRAQRHAAGGARHAGRDRAAVPDGSFGLRG